MAKSGPPAAWRRSPAIPQPKQSRSSDAEWPGLNQPQRARLLDLLTPLRPNIDPEAICDRIQLAIGLFKTGRPVVSLLATSAVMMAQAAKLQTASRKLREVADDLVSMRLAYYYRTLVLNSSGLVGESPVPPDAELAARIGVASTMVGEYAERLRSEGAAGGQSGAPSKFKRGPAPKPDAEWLAEEMAALWKFATGKRPSRRRFATFLDDVICIAWDGPRPPGADRLARRVVEKRSARGQNSIPES